MVVTRDRGRAQHAIIHGMYRRTRRTQHSSGWQMLCRHSTRTRGWRRLSLSAAVLQGWRSPQSWLLAVFAQY